MTNATEATMRPTARRSPILSAAAVLISLWAIAAQGAPSGDTPRDDSGDALLGRWIGTTGTDQERIVVGLEFQRDDSGAMKVLLTQPLSNYFGVDPGGSLIEHGKHITYEALGLELDREGDRLVGTFPGPNSRADLRRTQNLPLQSMPPVLPTGPEPKWQTRLGGLIYATPTVAEGVAYIGSTAGVFHAVNVHDGSLRWTFAAGKPIYGRATLADTAVYFVCDNGYLFKLAIDDGKEIWRYALGDAKVSRIPPHPAVFDWDWQAARPLVVDGVIYVGSGDGGMHVIDASTGKRRWRFDTRGRIRHGAAVDGERVVFGSGDHHVYALQREDGKEVWRFDTGADVDTTPVLHAGKVLVGNRGAGLFSLEAATGTPVWKLYFWGSWVESTPVIVDGVIYIGSSDLRRVSAIDFATGKVQWRSDVYGWTFGTPLVMGDRIHIGTAGGTPYFIAHQASYSVLDRKTGKLLARRPLVDAGGHQWGIAGSLSHDGDTVVYATIEGSLFGVSDSADAAH